MKKYTFWLSMLAVSLMNGAIFYVCSADIMRSGIEGVDNQASLLFIPMLWILAVFVLFALHAAAWVQGRNIPGEQKIRLLAIFRLSALPAKEKAHRVAFLIAVCLLMLFGYGLFADQPVWAVSYALSGGMFLLLLYAWKNASEQPNPTAG